MELKIKELPVTEENYFDIMKGKVEPFLDEYRQSDYFKGWDGNSLYYEKFIIPDAIGSIVILHGFTECTVKYREMIYYYILMGYNIFIYDQRGHGRSFRYAKNPETVSINKFEEYVNDAELFIDTVVKPASGELPLYLYAHSMGGAVAIQYLQKHDDVIAKAVLTAPMVLCKTAGLPTNFALFIARTFTLLGKGHDSVVGSKGFNPDRKYTESNNTSEIRFKYIHGNKSADKQIQTCDASYKWLREAVLVSRRNLDPKLCAKIKTPILVCQAEDDGSVYSEKEDDFIKLVKGGKLVHFKDSRHEIFGSSDSVVLYYVNTIEEFLKS